MTNAILTTVVLAGLSGAATAQDAGQGQEYYIQYCATCHGLEAEGNGPMAPGLVLQPTDLTALSQGNDGVFPALRVVKRIDGREPLVSHGSPMPVFGDFFQGLYVTLTAPDGETIKTSRPIIDLVTWLEEIQK